MVKMLGPFVFHVGDRKASRARHSEFVGVLPSPESDLRHLPSPFAGAAGYYKRIARTSLAGVQAREWLVRVRVHHYRP
jgi:hypothetical protein